MSANAPRVRGIGGVFFKARDPDALMAWYREQLGFDIQAWGGTRFAWTETGAPNPGYTVWSAFKAETRYLEPSDKPYMLNLCVTDLEGLLTRLRAGGADVLDRREDGEFGKFGYVLDPEGTLLELWEPA